MSVQIPHARPAFGRAGRRPHIYDQATEPVFAVRADRRSSRRERHRPDDLARWLAIGALALVTIVFVLIVFQ